MLLLINVQLYRTLAKLIYSAKELFEDTFSPTIEMESSKKSQALFHPLPVHVCHLITSSLRPKPFSRKFKSSILSMPYAMLGTGMTTQDTSSSVLLFFDKKIFIFNVGKGLQHFYMEHKIKLSKIDLIFLSCVCSETADKLPGLLFYFG